MSSARTLEKDKYEVGENRTHDTYEHYPLSRDSITQWVMLKKQPNMFLSSLINSHRLRERNLRSYPLFTYYS